MTDRHQLPQPTPADQQEFLRVFLANEREILRYIVTLVPSLADAQEILQQTALVLWEKFGDYDRSRPFTPWGCRFALNVTRQWMAKRQRWQAVLESGLVDLLAARREELRPEFDGRLKHLNGCLEKLPKEHRTLVDGYYFRQLGIEAVAQEAMRSTEAVYKALQRIRLQLRNCIEQATCEESVT